METLLTRLGEYLPAIFGAILLACFGGFIAYRNNRLSRLAAAASAFRASFADILSSLRNEREDAHQLLETAFKQHESAVVEFARFLGPIKRKRFLEEWKAYYCHESANILFLEQYSGAGSSSGKREMRRNLAIKRIEQLLSYAKQT